MDTLESLSPWFYDFDLGEHGRTESRLEPAVRPIHQTRLEMVNVVLDSYFATRSPDTITCADVGCHEGFYSIEVAKRGVKHLFGFDVREDSLRKARFVAGVLRLNNVEFIRCNAEQISATDVNGSVNITLFLGILYHLENPMLCLRRAASITEDVCILETQIIDEVEGETEWGAWNLRQAYRGVLALIDESEFFDAGNAEMGATPIATCPSRTGLAVMLRHAGFKRVEFVTPPDGAYEQHARGKRVVCAAYKT